MLHLLTSIDISTHNATTATTMTHTHHKTNNTLGQSKPINRYPHRYQHQNNRITTYRKNKSNSSKNYHYRHQQTMTINRTYTHKKENKSTGRWDGRWSWSSCITWGRGSPARRDSLQVWSPGEAPWQPRRDGRRIPARVYNLVLSPGVRSLCQVVVFPFLFCYFLFFS